MTDQPRILPDLAAMQAQIEALKAELEAAKASKASKLTYKVGEKGNVCVYGLGRFPTSLYASQWERIIADIDNLKAFIDANRPRLATKA